MRYSITSCIRSGLVRWPDTSNTRYIISCYPCNMGHDATCTRAVICLMHYYAMRTCTAPFYATCHALPPPFLAPKHTPPVPAILVHTHACQVSSQTGFSKRQGERNHLKIPHLYTAPVRGPHEFSTFIILPCNSMCGPAHCT